MILAPISDPFLRSAVRRAALPEEDVFHTPEDVRDACRFGFPRLVVFRPGDGPAGKWNLSRVDSHIPTLALTSPTLRNWESAWRMKGLAVSKVDDSALRLRTLMLQAGQGNRWVEEFLSDLSLVLGRGLPSVMRGMARRVMEYPTRYLSLEDLGGIAGLTPGALKGRFRRRDLPSPARYLRWFRVSAAAHVLADPVVTTLAASYRMGFASDGNFCRWVQATCGLPTSVLRRRSGRTILLIRLAESCFPNGSLERWASLEDIFLRAVA